MTNRQKLTNQATDPLPMTAMQQSFCEHYVKTFNAHESALHAGYSKKYAEAKAYQLVEDNKDYILALQRLISARVAVDAESVQRELAQIAFANVLDYMEDDPESPGEKRFKPPHKLTREQASAIVSVRVIKNKDGRVKYTYSLDHKRASLMDLARVMGILNEMQVHHKHTLDLSKVPTAQLEEMERMWFSLASQHGVALTGLAAVPAPGEIVDGDFREEG